MSFTVETNSHTEVLDITSSVNTHVPSEFNDGLVIVYCAHTTAALIINEFEGRLGNDIEEYLTDVVPESTSYSHDQIDNNASAHLRTILLGESVVAPVVDGSVSLGTWQSILLVECDGPQERSISVRTIRAHSAHNE